MSPEEIIERVRICVQGGRDYCRSMDLGEPTTIQHCSDIDHLLAIHAAVVEYLSARQGYFGCTASEDHLKATRTKLADLCGWKAEGG